MGFFKLFFYFLLFYLIYRFIRFVWLINKAQKNFRDSQPFGNQNHNRNNSREGETVVKYIPEDENSKPDSSPVKKDEYIDYEEVK
jgi:hypothetical protein